MTEYKVVKDDQYGFFRLDPIPTSEDVEKYYLEEFYSSNYQMFNNSQLEIQKKDQEFFESRWEKMYQVFVDYFGDMTDKSLFDIGFGFAQALIYFKNKGLCVSGVEPSPEGVGYAESQGLDVFKGGIENFDQIDERYSIVTLINVLEHLRDPFTVLTKIREQLLAEGGLLAIDVPNDFNDFQTIANDEYDLNQWWVCPPNHINYFSCSTLSNVLDAAGYNIFLRDASFPLEIFMLFGDVYVGRSDIGKLCHQKRVKFEQLMKKHGKTDKLKRFYTALAELDLGRNAIVYCTPK